MTHKWMVPRQTCALALATSLAGCGADHKAAQGPSEAPDPPHACAGDLNATTATSFYEAARCLFEGDSAPQMGVEVGTIDRARVAIVRGTAQDREGTGLAGVHVTVVHHPEYGETVTDGEGEYAVAVNGGEALTLRLEKEGFLTAQRRRLTEWQQFSAFPAVSLLPASKAVTAVNLNAAQQPVLAASDVNKDADGERQQAVLIRPGTTVTLDMPDGTKQTLDQFHLRATEYTVGAAGPSAMPGELPLASGYTYATEFSLDEARDAGATRVEFDPPVVSYVDNFLSFPAGTSVPAGYYDPEQDQWQPGQGGLVLDVVAVEKGKAALDVDGDGEADDEATLFTLGIDATELEALGSRYRAGASIWRVPLAHFSAWDFNWGFGPPADAEAPDMGVETSGPLDCKTSVSGSIIGCEDQTLGEAIPVAGTPFALHYQSERTPGRIDSHDLAIRVSGAKVPKSLKRIDVEVEVLGKVTHETFEPKPDQSYHFHWDGEDPWGRVWQGRQVAKVRVGYSYDGAYERTPGFGAPGSGVEITASRTRQDVTFWKEWRGNVGSLSAQPLGLGGWTLDAQHLYDPRGRVLHLGSGEQRTAEGLGTFVTTVAGTGKEGSSGDGGPALDATLAQPHGIVVAPDGTAFFADDLHHVIRKIAPNGTIETIAGTGEADFSGDGGLATAAALNKPMGLALGRDGTLYMADGANHRVRAISPKGRIRTIAGGGETEVDADADAVPALEAAFLEPHALALSNDGNLYMADNTGNAVYRLGTDGLITRLAGGGTTAKTGELAADAALQSPLGLSLGPSGELYIAEFDGNRISKVDSSGRYWIVAGTGAPGFSGDRGPAVLAELYKPHTVDVGPDGSLYVTDEGNRRVRRITPDGYIDTVAGSGQALSGEESGDNGPPLAAPFSQPRVVYVHKDGSLWIADYTDARIRRIRPALPGFVNGETILASSSGTELFAFDSAGRHLRTLDAVTGVTLLAFEYDPEGRLTGIRDREGSLTAVSRDKKGRPEAIVGPYGQRTDSRSALTATSRGSRTPPGNSGPSPTRRADCSKA